ncbi:NAD(P)/FAD-dependent oxidoreductase [Alteromonas sp. a30]|uniref:NAD(P)/FAD-dependent oxidoreductase n=1 Tax=Alteromonas sp. a30 TaxID=2730917 RepID=UPI002280DC9A|nr:hypothetical protein [Alteromonas sp. a30]MCY7296318.1 hypothetical protein [Alteromonas sp. a30]
MSSVRNESLFEQQHSFDECSISGSYGQVIETDIAIIGAGIGGCITALALAPHYSVTLVDVERSQPIYLGETLPYSARYILEKLSLDDILSKHLCSRRGLISDWGNEEIHTLGCHRNPDGLGWIVNHRMLEQQLREKVVLRGIPDLRSLSLQQSALHEDKWRLFLSGESPEHKQTVSAKVVVEATGRQATFANQQGARYAQEDQLVSVWMTYRSKESNEISSVHPAENGWWYCSPIPETSLHQQPQTTAPSGNGTLMLLSYQTDSDLLDTGLLTSTESLIKAAQFIPELKKVLAKRISGSEAHCGVKNVNSSRLLAPDMNNWFAVGDAAMSLDPLSSQALFQAMASAMQLSELIINFGIESEVSKTAISFEFQQQLERIWHQFEAEKLSYYAQERRWSTAIFWERRAA